MNSLHSKEKCRRNSTKRSTLRRGAAAVEFAMTAPLLFLLLFGALELSHANMIFNTTEAAAYEGAREGIVPGASAAECVAVTERMLEIAGVRNAVIEVFPANLKTDSQAVEVRISVPYDRNTIVAPLFTKNLSIVRSCRLTREKL